MLSRRLEVWEAIPLKSLLMELNRSWVVFVYVETFDKVELERLICGWCSSRNREVVVSLGPGCRGECFDGVSPTFLCLGESGVSAALCNPDGRATARGR